MTSRFHGKNSILIHFTTYVWCALFISISCSNTPNKSDPFSENDPNTSANLNNAAITVSGSLPNAHQLAEIVQQIADSLTALHLIYDARPEKMRDCSGVFLRFLAAMKKAYPNLPIPNPKTARSSQAIAGWYIESQKFVPVSNALVQSRDIRPGTILFYGKRWTSYSDITLSQTKQQISHVGVVVDVQHDITGEVRSYRLFHGRSRGKPAMITDWHKRKPSRANLPPFGNWDEQWLGMATFF